ncbi:MAG: sugar ABC transporter permease [Bauldia sp.]
MLPSLAVIDVWQTTPQVMLVLFAGLLTIPKDLKEAAIVDGAGLWATFRNITIPFLMPYLLVAMMIRAIELLQVLDIVLVATLGGPEDASLVLHLYAYRQDVHERLPRLRRRGRLRARLHHRHLLRFDGAAFSGGAGRHQLRHLREPADEEDLAVDR